jgi:carbon dioxide concentrating mechanism protein CcmN
LLTFIPASEVKISMSLPPLRLGHNFDVYISGEVIVHPSAVIAPGTILQAAPNSKIIIGSGVCIGMGSILKVHEGTLEVESGANLGAGLLMIGQGKIGANACIGSATTIFNCSVAPGQVVPPGSILGDTSRQVLLDSTGVPHSPKPPASAGNNPTSASGIWNANNGGNTGDGKHNASNPAFTQPSSEAIAQQPPQDQYKQEPVTESTSIGTHIYGQQSIQKLLITLFPHRQSLNQPNSDEQSE